MNSPSARLTSLARYSTIKSWTASFVSAAAVHFHRDARLCRCLLAVLVLHAQDYQVQALGEGVFRLFGGGGLAVAEIPSDGLELAAAARDQDLEVHLKGRVAAAVDHAADLHREFSARRGGDIFRQEAAPHV